MRGEHHAVRKPVAYQDPEISGLGLQIERHPGRAELPSIHVVAAVDDVKT
jgi:hypothetical protein